MYCGLFLSKSIFSAVVFVAELFLHCPKQSNSENSKQKQETPVSAGTRHARVQISNLVKRPASSCLRKNMAVRIALNLGLDRKTGNGSK